VAADRAPAKTRGQTPVTRPLNRDLLQALEHTLETLERMTDVLRSTLTAVERGETIPRTVIGNYRTQLDSVEADAAKMKAFVQSLWGSVEQQ
jgi:hypothetical protein